VSPGIPNNRTKSLKYNKANDVSDRRSAASNAKAALLQGYLAAKDAAEPTRIAKQAERLALAEARETRRTEREQVKRDELARIAQEVAAREAVIVAAARAGVEARELVEKNRVARVLEDEAARKLERDRRYANRKARRA